MATQVQVAMRQGDVRSWDRRQQRIGLHAVAARAVLAVLPDHHAARRVLEEAVAEAADLLPTDG